MAQVLTALGFSGRVFFLNTFAFVLLFGGLTWKVFRPLAKVMRQRAEEIAAGLEASRQNKEVLARADQERERILAAAREEGREHVRRAVQEADAERERILAETRAEVQALRDRGREALAREHAQALLELRHRVVDLALLAAGRAVVQRLDESQYRIAVDTFIGDLERAQPAVEGASGLAGVRLPRGVEPAP